MANPSVVYDGPIVTWLDAQERKLVRYFTGDPCKHGHIAERFTANRNCCVCARRQYAKYYATGAGQETIKAYRFKNRPRANVASKKWRTCHPEKRAGIAARWVRENKERDRSNKTVYRAANRELYRASHRKWRKKYPDKAKANWKLNKARRKGAEGHFTADDIAKIRRQQKDKCAACLCKLNGGGQLDHIKPIARGGTNWPHNLQWLCGPCNRAKWHKDPIEFMQSLGRLL